LNLPDVLEKELIYALSGMLFFFGVSWWVPSVINHFGRKYFSWPFNRALSRWWPFVLSSLYIYLIRINQVPVPQVAFIALIAVCCYGIIRCDLFFHVIPDRFHVVSFLVVLGLLYVSHVSFEEIIIRVLFAFFVYVGFVVLNSLYSYARSKDGIGLGDVKLFSWLSILFFEGVFEIILYSLMLSVLLVIPMYVVRKRDFNEGFAFAPAILFGVLGYLLMGTIY